MNSLPLSPARKYVYQYAIYKIEIDQMLFDFEEQKAADQLNRERRSSLRAQIDSLRAKGRHLIRPDNAHRFPPYIHELYDNDKPQPLLGGSNSLKLPADTQVLDVPSAGNATPIAHGLRRGKTKGRNIAAQMMSAMSKNSEALYWTLNKWANHLGCSSGTIGGLRFWEYIMKTRAEELAARAEKADQTAFRSKGGRSRR